MIVRIQPSGGSFLGAGKYYLHDKAADAALDKHLKPRTDERVWFSDTRNLLNNDPEKAFEEMWRTAEDQAHLKMQAGVKRGGRVCEDPVKTLSLSWHKDDRPTPEHMIESADAFLKHMGWDGHQAVFVGHNDTEHRHIHIILNRVNHENGRTIDDFREQKRAQSWALSYEKEQENVRCEERELRAAKREHREPDLRAAREADKPSEQHHDAKRLRPAPANDHLPHNVMMLSREHERAFTARERAREIADRDQRAQLKAAQRAEREAFFKDGAEQFKALRHTVYDKVRKEYAPEWRQLYKESEVASRSADAWSTSSISRALYFAKSGKWESAANAFADRNGVRDAVTAELFDRKSELKARQTEDLRERQREACDALRERRDAEYQKLLQRQREERGALAAGVTLDAIGMGRDSGTARSVGNAPDQLANQNHPLPIVQLGSDRHAPDAERADERRHGHDGVADVAREQSVSLAVSMTPETVDRIAAETLPVVGPVMEAPEVTRQIADLAAGGIGQVASYLADQLGELFAPTPPEVREAQAKAEAKRNAEKPTASEKPDPYAKIIDAAAHLAEEEHKTGTYWKERDRGKGWERDQ